MNEFASKKNDLIQINSDISSTFVPDLPDLLEYTFHLSDHLNSDISEPESIKSCPTSDSIKSCPTSDSTNNKSHNGKFKFEIFGNSHVNKSWKLPLCYETLGNGYPRPNFTRLEDDVYLIEMNAIHTYMHQKYHIILHDIKKFIPPHKRIMVIGKLVWDSNVSDLNILSLSTSYSKPQEYNHNFIIVDPFVDNKNDYNFIFYLRKHTRNASNHRCCLHILVRMNGIEIILAKYYIIVNGHSYTQNAGIKEFIANASPLLKTGFVDLPIY